MVFADLHMQVNVQSCLIKEEKQKQSLHKFFMMWKWSLRLDVFVIITMVPELLNSKCTNPVSLKVVHSSIETTANTGFNFSPLSAH